MLLYRCAVINLATVGGDLAELGGGDSHDYGMSSVRKTVQRTVGARGLILFKTKMADFGNAVTAEQTEQ